LSVKDRAPVDTRLVIRLAPSVRNWTLQPASGQNIPRFAPPERVEVVDS
jgi:hypothetical protein